MDDLSVFFAITYGMVSTRNKIPICLNIFAINYAVTTVNCGGDVVLLLTADIKLVKIFIYLYI